MIFVTEQMRHPAAVFLRLQKLCLAANVGMFRLLPLAIIAHKIIKAQPAGRGGLAIQKGALAKAIPAAKPADGFAHHRCHVQLCVADSREHGPNPSVIAVERRML